MKHQRAKNIYAALPQPVRMILRGGIVPPIRTFVRYAPWKSGKLFVWNKVASHLWWMESPVLTETSFGCEMVVDARDIVGKYIYYFGLWEPFLTEWITGRLKEGDTFVDVGANIGYFTLLASRLVGSSGGVVAIEALPSTAKLLKENVDLNGAKNVRIVNVAAWNKHETLTFFTEQDHTAGTTTCVASWADSWGLDRACKVPAAPLCELLTRDEIKKVRVVKIDVEGAEWQAVQGIEPIISEFRKDVEFVIEVNFKVLREQGASALELQQLFKKWGFNAYSMRNDYSAGSYIFPKSMSPPERISHLERDDIAQMDVIFSRIDSFQL